MTTAYVTLPFAGSVTVCLDEIDGALTEQEMIDAAMDLVDLKIEAGDNCDINEWDVHRHLVQGNVVYASTCEASVEVKDE